MRPLLCEVPPCPRQSPYVRLEAAKDILDRNGVGTAKEPPRSQQLVVNINLGDAMPAISPPTVVVDEEAHPLMSPQGQGVENDVLSLGATSPTHDFSTEVLDDRIAAPLMLERSKIDSGYKEKGAQDFFADESDFDI